MSTTTKAAPTKKVVIDDIQKGDVFSETSHYQFIENAKPLGLAFTHLESGETIYLTTGYVSDLLCTADQYEKEVAVGREDKLWTAKQIADAILKGDLPKDTKVREGDVRVKGIRTLFEEIYNAEVFALSFLKQDKPLSAKKLNELRTTQSEAAVAAIEKARVGKKSMAAVYAEQIRHIQENPILPYEAGEERVLRGFKIQFSSRDGRYDCIDMDLKAPDNIRPVNINTLQWLVYKGVKYVLEK